MKGESDPENKAQMLKLHTYVHMYGMLGIFLPSCGAPALMRLAQSLGYNMAISMCIIIPGLLLLTFPMGNAI